MYLPSVLLTMFYFLPLCLENFVQLLFQTRVSSDKLAIFLNASIFPYFLKDILTGHKTLSWVWWHATALPGALMIEALSLKLFSFKLVMLCSLPVVHKLTHSHWKHKPFIQLTSDVSVILYFSAFVSS